MTINELKGWNVGTILSGDMPEREQDKPNADKYSEEEWEATRALQGRIEGLLSRTRVIGAVGVRKIEMFQKIALQHFQGFLLGHQRLEEIVRATSAAGAWAGLPTDLCRPLSGWLQKPRLTLWLDLCREAEQSRSGPGT